MAARSDVERRWVIEQSGGALERPAAADPPPPAAPVEPPPIPLALARRLLKIAHAECFYADRCGCAGGGARCHHLARVVTLHDCAECLSCSSPV